MKTKNYWLLIFFLIFGVVFQLSAQEAKVLGNHFASRFGNYFGLDIELWNKKLILT